jgi:uncharacterized delta-60 repeat protein
MTRPRSPLSRARRPGRQALPRLEALEDRSVPSAGALDPAFNGGSFQSVDGINVLAVAVQPDSKIVVAGTIHTSTYAFAFHFIDHYYMAVARLNADGSPDTTFGTDGTGVVRPPFPNDSMLTGLALDPTSGAVVVTGVAALGSPSNSVVVRLTAAGLPDASFQSSDGLGTGEQLIHAWSGGTAVAVDPRTGAVVLAGSVGTSMTSTAVDFGVLRLTSGGAPDPTFQGSDGAPGSRRAIDFPLGGSTRYAAPTAIAVDCDGSIVVAGSASTDVSVPGSPTYFAVARLTRGGVPDAAFQSSPGLGAGRAVITGFGSGVANAVAIDPATHAIVLAGATPIPASAMAVVRLTRTGALDPTFHGSPGLPAGEQVLNVGHLASAAAVQTNGPIVLAGFVSQAGSGSGPEALVARLTRAGDLDPTFADGAGLETFGGLPYGPSAVALDANTGGIVLGAGQVGRLIGDPPVPVPPCPGSGGAVGAFDPATATWYLHSSATAGPPDAGEFAFGPAGSLPVAGDWSGLGQTGVGVFAPQAFAWFLRNETGAGLPDAGAFQYGWVGALPVAGDWSGSGHAGIGVFDPATATWFLRNEPDAGAPDAGVFQYGVPGAIPVVGDWTGTGHLGIGVFDPATATWFLRSSATPGAPDVGAFQYGGVGALPVAGDWSGSGYAGIGVFDPSTGAWYLRSEASAGAADAGVFAYGVAGWLPVCGAFAAPQFLLAAGGEGAGAAAVTADQLQSAVTAALARLSAAGVGPALLGGLASATYELGALPPGVLGQATAGRVTLSADAAGHGWFADPTPLQDEEFAPGGPGSPLVALSGSPAAGREDLLSAVLHEMGHLAGSPDGGTGLMAATLAPGTRDTLALDRVFGLGVL